MISNQTKKENFTQLNDLSYNISYKNKSKKNQTKEKEFHLKRKNNFFDNFNLINLKKHGFKYNVTDLITDLIKFKIWKIHHKKLKPIKNKSENLNYFQKSEKNLQVENLKNFEINMNKTYTQNKNIKLFLNTSLNEGNIYYKLR